VIPDDAHVELFPYVDRSTGRPSRTHFGVRGDPEELCRFSPIVAVV
jgi:hypothetical protein